MNIEKLKSKDGFTLPEVLVATLIVMIAVVGILYTYARCLELDEMSRNTTIALQAAQNQLETIKNTDYDQIFATFNGQTFTAVGITGRGSTRIDNTNDKLMKITITFCWTQGNGRLFGEDTNLNGVLNAGEDKNGNGSLDSPVQFVNYIYNE